MSSAVCSILARRGLSHTVTIHDATWRFDPAFSTQRMFPIATRIGESDADGGTIGAFIAAATVPVPAAAVASGAVPVDAETRKFENSAWITHTSRPTFVHADRVVWDVAHHLFTIDRERAAITDFFRYSPRPASSPSPLLSATVAAFPDPLVAIMRDYV
jgi:hypothetical protein